MSMQFGFYNGDKELWRTRMENVLYDVVMDYNNDHLSDIPSQFFLSDARRAEKQLVEKFETRFNELKQQKKSKTESFDEKSFYDFMEETLPEVLPDRVVGSYVDLRGKIAESTQDCNKVIGLPNDLTAIPDYITKHDRVKTGYSGRSYHNGVYEIPDVIDATGEHLNHAYPISPFDSRFVNLEATNIAGTRRMYIPSDEFGGMAVEELTHNFALASADDGLNWVIGTSEVSAEESLSDNNINCPGSKVHVKLNRRETQRGITYDDLLPGNPDNKSSEDELLVNLYDRAGVSRFKSRVSDAEYEMLKSNIKPVFDKANGGVDISAREFARFRNDAEIGVEVIDTLKARGLNGELMPDGLNGQIKYFVHDTGVATRVFDMQTDGVYLGRTYKDGVSLYLKSTERPEFVREVDGKPKFYRANELGKVQRDYKRDDTIHHGNGEYAPYTHKDVFDVAYRGFKEGVNAKSGGNRDFVYFANHFDYSTPSGASREKDYRSISSKLAESEARILEHAFTAEAGEPLTIPMDITKFISYQPAYANIDLADNPSAAAADFRNKRASNILKTLSTYNSLANAAASRVHEQRKADTISVALLANGFEPLDKSEQNTYDSTKSRGDNNFNHQDSFRYGGGESSRYLRSIEPEYGNFKLTKSGDITQYPDVSSLMIFTDTKARSAKDGREYEYKKNSPNLVRNYVEQARDNIAMSIGLDEYNRRGRSAYERVGVGNLFYVAQDYALDWYAFGEQLIETRERMQAEGASEEEITEAWLEMKEPSVPMFVGGGDIARLQTEYVKVLAGVETSLTDPTNMFYRGEDDDAVVASTEEEEIGEMHDDTESSEEEISVPDLEIKEFSEIEDEYNALPEAIRADITPEFYPRYELVQRHMQRYLDTQVGTYELGEDGKRFSIDLVAHNVAGSLLKNKTTLISAIRRDNRMPITEDSKIEHIALDEFRLNGHSDRQYANETVAFDEESAVSLQSMIDAAQGNQKEQLERIKAVFDKAFVDNGVNVDSDSLLMDATGRVRYNGTINYQERNFGAEANGKARKTAPVEGYVGPIFLPDDNGFVHVNQETDKDYVYAPGYVATILPSDKYEGNVDDRTVYRGYMNVLEDTLSRTLRDDLVKLVDANNAREPEFYAGQPNSLLRFYRTNSSNAVRHEPDFEKTMLSHGFTQDEINALIRDEANMVNYDKTLGLESNATTLIALRQRPELARNSRFIANDDPSTAWGNVQQQNLAILSGRTQRYSTAKTPTTKTQGTKLYFAPGVKLVEMDDNPGVFVADDSEVVNDHGVGVYSAGEEAIVEHFFNGNDYNQFDQWNRQQMGSNNYADAIGRTAKPVGIAQITLGGFNQDDAFVVSRSFAESNLMKGGKRDASGNIKYFERPLIVGDKLSDAHGNKGVISLIVDPQWSEQEARARGALGAWALFRENPDLDVAVSPFSAISRNNAGTAREIMGNGVADLNIPRMTKEGELEYDADDNVVCDTAEASLGQINIIIHSKAADKDSINYTSEMREAGKARSAGWQLNSVLRARGCENMLGELFGHNGSDLRAVREHMRSVGMDMDDTGKLQLGLQQSEDFLVINDFGAEDGFVSAAGVYPYPTVYENRDGYVVPPAEYVKKNGIAATARNEVVNRLSLHGGVLRVPFPLKFPNATRKGVDGQFETVELGTIPVSEGVRDNVRNLDLYDMPVLSAKLRSGVDYNDGTVTNHEYTNQYTRIVENLNEWYSTYDSVVASGQEAGVELTSYDEVLDFASASAKDSLTKAENAIQRAFGSIAEDIKEHKLSGNKNEFKTKLMSTSLERAATSVWSPNPALDIDEVGMSAKTREALGVKVGQRVLLWRDPVLDDNCVRYVRVANDNSVSGVSVHPGMATPISGDFDGDKVGIAVLKTKAARDEAYDKLSFDTNLLNVHQGKVEIGVGDNGEPIMGYDLNYGTGLDAQIGRYYNPELDAEYQQLVRDINEFEASASDNTFKVNRDARRQFISRLSDNLTKTLNSPEAMMAVSFKDDLTHIQSLQEICVDTGAKGSISKLVGKEPGIGKDNLGCYAHYLGVTVDLDDNENIVAVETNVDEKGNPKSFRTVADDISCQQAMSAKSLCTSSPGKDMQERLNMCNTEAGMTYANVISQVFYQKTLDWKHDGAVAMREAPMLTEGVKALLRGKSVDISVDENGNQTFRQVSLKSDELLTPEQWVSVHEKVNDYLDVEIDHDVMLNFARDVAGEAGVVPDMSDVYSRIHQSPLAACAFTEDFGTLVTAAELGTDLYGGFYGESFAPDVVKRAKEGEKVSLIAPDSRNRELKEIFTVKLTDEVTEYEKYVAGEDTNVVEEPVSEVVSEKQSQRLSVDASQLFEIEQNSQKVTDSPCMID